MKTEHELEIDRLRKRHAELITLLREIDTALLANGWSYDYIRAKIAETLKAE